MTRKDYRLIAQVIRDAILTPAMRRSLALDMAIALSDEGGYDLNGNRRFKTDVFLQACGVMQ